MEKTFKHNENPKVSLKCVWENLCPGPTYLPLRQKWKQIPEYQEVLQDPWRNGKTQHYFINIILIMTFSFLIDNVKDLSAFWLVLFCKGSEGLPYSYALNKTSHWHHWAWSLIDRHPKALNGKSQLWEHFPSSPASHGFYPLSSSLPPPSRFHSIPFIGKLLLLCKINDS